MKFKAILTLVCMVTICSLAPAKEKEQKPPPPKEKSYAIKVGYFNSNESEEVAGQHHLNFDNSYAVGVEYYSVYKNDKAISVGAFYSEPDLEGRVWDTPNNRWVAAAAKVNVRQVAVSYIKFGGSVTEGLDKYEGGFYGIGVGFSDYSVGNRLESGAGAYIINQGVFEENTLDLVLTLGYRFDNHFGVDLKWIVDEDAYTLFGSRWY